MSSSDFLDTLNSDENETKSVKPLYEKPKQSEPVKKYKKKRKNHSH